MQPLSPNGDAKLGAGSSRIPHLGRGNPGYMYRLGDEMLESSPKERNLQVLIDSKLLTQDSGHSTKPDGVQEVLGQCSQTHSLLLFDLFLG